MSQSTPNSQLALGVALGGLVDPKVGLYKAHSVDAAGSTAVVESTQGTLLQIRVREIPAR